MEYLTLEEVLDFHAQVKGIPLHQAREHIHRLDLLESALSRPENAARYEDADLIAQAATLLWGLVRDHPFVDGNKRTALVATRVFIAANGGSLQMSSDEKFDLVVSVANRRLSVNDVASRLRDHVTLTESARSEVPKRARRQVPKKTRAQKRQRRGRRA